jgi:hypothetical protein
VLAVYGSTLFASGLFVLAAAGTRYTPAVYAWIALLAAAVALPVAVAGCLVAGLEGVTGRAWLSGARRLQADERHLRATAARGVRYASWVWLSNGLALWAATVLSQFAA